MAELVIASKEIAGFYTHDIIKVYNNGYYRYWKKKGIPLAGTFILRLPFINAREVKRLFLRVLPRKKGHHRRQYRVRFNVNVKNKPCVTKRSFNIAKWIESK